LREKLNSLSKSEAWWQSQYRKIDSANVNAKTFAEIIDSYEEEQKNLEKKIIVQEEITKGLKQEITNFKIENSTKNALDYMTEKTSADEWQRKIKQVRDEELV
jgi:hypothetical protein